MSGKKDKAGPDPGTTPPDEDMTRFKSEPEASEAGDDRTRIALPTETAKSIPPLAQPNTPNTVTKSVTTIGVGTLINNNYEITRVLKSGGMGEVYGGVEIGTGDPVAIKAILPELAEDEKAGLLFKREARTLRQLTDEVIVRYYNYVHDQSLDRYFLVMEFVEGVPLSDHLEGQGKLPVPAVFKLLRRLSRGLSNAHERGVVHRDLSPDNVMLPGDDVDRARLIDFGIAKSNVVQEGTMHGQFAGKFKFVAPEQLGHYGGEVGPHTDMYGLGLLTAAAAIGEPLNMGGSIVEAVQSRQRVPDLSAVPEVLRPILCHMLEPDPARRPKSMQVLRDMLKTPTLIPVQYRSGLPLPSAMDLGGQTALPQSGTTTPPPVGLQVPLVGAGTRLPQTETQDITPKPAAQGSRSDPKEHHPEGKALKLLIAAFVVTCGVVGFGAWNMGMIGNTATRDTAEPGAATSGQTGIPDPLSTTRAGFLAGFDAGQCTLLSRTAAGPNAGMIEGYSRTGETFPGLPVVYEEQFGARPGILPRQITEAQCAALEFTRSLQGRGRGAPVLQMSGDVVASGDALTARITGLGTQAVWASLITPTGEVFNLTDRLSDPVGGTRNLSFGLTLAQGADAVPQLIMVVASDTPLARTATATDGASAATLLPSVLDEIAGKGGAASASIAYVLLEPSTGTETGGDAPVDIDVSE